MTKEVKIKITGIQSGPDMDGEVLETITSGEYFFKNNKHYILYEELPEGESRVIKNRMKFTNGYMELTKSGPVSVQMIMEPGQKHMCNYLTPFGTLLMGIEASAVEMRETETEISLTSEYALEIDGAHTADCKITVSVKPR